MQNINAAQESRVRSKARRLGYHVCKSRERKYVPHSNNRGEFMLLNDRNTVVIGERFEASLDDIERLLDGHDTSPFAV